MTRTEEAIKATVRRYGEALASNFPSDMACANQFANIRRWAIMPDDDRLMVGATLSIEAIWRLLKLGSPSLKTITRILAAVKAA